jgi:hypothetical protein
MLRPPGTGKSMLARRLSTILPAMPLAEAIETTRIHCVAALTGGRATLVSTRACSAPDHISCSDVAVPLLLDSMLRFAPHCSGLHTLSNFSNGMGSASADVEATHVCG